MNLAEKAFVGVLPDKEMPEIDIKYSGRFSGYNGNIRLRKTVFSEKITVSISKKWRGIDQEIKLGLIQELILKLYKKKKTTLNTDLYNKFIKNVHIAVPKTDSDPLLEQIFHDLNEKYFFGFLDKPNLKWGAVSFRKLGSYTYTTDTISISSVFKQADKELLEYIMYHEMLHKKHKFNHKNGRSYHHTSKFKEQEKAYPNSVEIEKRIRKLIPIIL